MGVYQLTPNVTALAYPQIATTQPLVLTSPSQVCGWPGCTPAGRRHAGPLHRSLLHAAGMCGMRLCRLGSTLLWCCC